MTWAGWSKEEGVFARSLASHLALLEEAAISYCGGTLPENSHTGGKCGPGGLMGKEGVRELGLGPHSGPGRPLLQFKINK